MKTTAILFSVLICHFVHDDDDDDESDTNVEEEDTGAEQEIEAHLEESETEGTSSSSSELPEIEGLEGVLWRLQNNVPNHQSQIPHFTSVEVYQFPDLKSISEPQTPEPESEVLTIEKLEEPGSSKTGSKLKRKRPITPALKLTVPEGERGKKRIKKKPVEESKPGRLSVPGGHATPSTSRQPAPDPYPIPILPTATHCPVNNIPNMICLWFGTRDELAAHMEGVHSDIMVSLSFGCRATSTTMALILYKDEVFLYYKLITEDRNWHIFLQKAGITQQDFNYSITLSTGLPVNDSISTFSVTDISDKFECIYRNAFSSTHFAIEPYISGNEVNMTVTIEARSWY